MWVACGWRVAGTWVACGWCVGGMWMVCEWHVRGVWMACGWHVCGVWVACGWHLSGVWMACGWCVGGVWMACRDRRVCLTCVAFSQARIGSRDLFGPGQLRKEGEVSSWEDGVVLGRGAVCTSWTVSSMTSHPYGSPPCRKPKAAGSWSCTGPGSPPKGVGHPCPRLSSSLNAQSRFPRGEPPRRPP